MGRLELFLCLWVCAAGSAFAGGPVHGARAAGMGTALNAVAADPSAILFNPAGLTQVKGTAVYGGATALKPETKYTAPAEQKETTQSQLFFPPNLYFSSGPGKDNLVLGIGFYSPFGIGGRKWSRTGLMRYASTESTMGTFSVNPTIAWQVSPAVSLGAGFDYMRAETKMERMVSQSMVGAADAITTLYPGIVPDRDREERKAGPRRGVFATPQTRRVRPGEVTLQKDVESWCPNRLEAS